MRCGKISEYVGLRPKMYALTISTPNTGGDDNIGRPEEIKRAKGIKKYVVNDQIKPKHYKESLFNIKTFTHEMNLLTSKDHRIFSDRINKKSLSPFDDKKWIAINDGIATYAHGYVYQKVL